MKISIVIPNYNGEKILGNNLPKVFASINNLKEETEIIITDDSSTDNSLKIIKDFIEDYKDSKTEIKLIENSKNLGFASNVNKGVGESTGDILVLLNTDVIPNENFLAPILPHFKDDAVFGVGCMDESIENRKTHLRGRGKGVWNKGFLMHSAAPTEGKDTLWIAGGSGVFRKSIWDKLGGLDTLYNPFYWEDIDLSYRARKFGYSTLFENKSIVRHEHEKGAIKSKFKSEEVKKIAYRNQLIFSWKNSDLTTFFIGVFWLPYHLLRAIASGDKALLLGFIEALRILPGIFQSRRNVRKLFKLSDKEVTHLVS